MANVWIDLTHEIDETTLVYPGDPQVEISPKNQRVKDDFSLRQIHTAMHVGTHLDAPSHYLKDGMDVESIPLERFLGIANVIHIKPDQGLIRTKDLQDAWETLPKTDKLLLDTSHATKFNTTEYFSQCPSFEPTFFDFLHEQGIRLIGIDLPTVQYQNVGPAKAHEDLLSDGIVIVEGLNKLDQLSNTVFFGCPPLKIKGMDGSMVRAFALVDSSLL